MSDVKQKLISLVLIGLLLASAQAPLSSQANKIAASSSQPEGFSPFAIEVTKGGQYAYLGFDGSEVIFKVRLTDLAIVASADLSAYFPIECGSSAGFVLEAKNHVGCRKRARSKSRFARPYI